jgi:hypothetical protein
MTSKQEFFFEENPVGYLDVKPLPCKPGRYHYEPYRGPGHYRLMAALKSVGPQRCHCVIGGKKRQFIVSAWISYGVLELSAFEASES